MDRSPNQLSLCLHVCQGTRSYLSPTEKSFWFKMTIWLWAVCVTIFSDASCGYVVFVITSMCAKKNCLQLGTWTFFGEYLVKWKFSECPHNIILLITLVVSNGPSTNLKHEDQFSCHIPTHCTRPVWWHKNLFFKTWSTSPEKVLLPLFFFVTENVSNHWKSPVVAFYSKAKKKSQSRNERKSLFVMMVITWS